MIRPAARSKRLRLAPFSATLLGVATRLSASPAQAASSCLSPHCYAALTRGFSPGATEIWTTLRTYCMTLDGTTSGHDSNELWAEAPGSNNYVEFGHTRFALPGIPLSHWFWARTNNNVQEDFHLNIAFVNQADYNATIKWTGASGQWQFIQGGSLFGNGSGNWPVGPVSTGVLGAEIYASTTLTQNSVFDTNSGRVQSGVYYSDWANPPRTFHDVPPFDSLGSFGNTWISDENPSVGGVLGC